MTPLQKAAQALKNRVPLVGAFETNKFRASFSNVVLLEGSTYDAAEVLFTELLSGAYGLNMQRLMEVFAFHNRSAEKPVSLDFELELLSFQLRFAAQCLKHSDSAISLNVSPWLIGQEKLMALLKAASSFCEANRVILEITEYAKIRKSSLLSLVDIKNFGYKIALDDVGSGVYRNIVYLKEIADLAVVDIIKYDTSMKRFILRDSLHFIADVTMAFGSNVLYVAEGVRLSRMTDRRFLKLYQAGIGGMQIFSCD